MKILYFSKISIIIILFYLYEPINKKIFFILDKNIENIFVDNSKFIHKTNQNYSFKTLFFSEYKNESVQLINEIYEKSIDVIIINNTLKINSSNFIFSQPGIHEILISIKFKQLSSIDYLFYQITNLLYINFLNINEKIDFHSLKGVFKGCQNLRSINFNEFSFNNIYDLSHLFSDCKLLSFVYPIIHFSEKVTNISYMFANCSSLKSVYLTYFNSINIIDLSGLFYGCSTMTSIDLSNFQAFNVKNIEFMFAGCTALKSINLENFEFNKIEKFNNAFLNCINLKSVNFPFLTKNSAKKFRKMFIGCNKSLLLKLQNIYSKSNNLNDICIVGLWYGCNYGSMLTYYALHEVIKNLNYSIMMIDNPLEPDNIIYTKMSPKYMVNSFYRVSKKNKLDNLIQFNKECKSFLVGSDQLWNINLSRKLKQFYFLGFANNETKKFSYGTSFDVKYKGNEEEKIITKTNLERFDGISVRDKLSLETLQNDFRIQNVVQVCDPTLLCNISDYTKLISRTNIKYNEEYLLAYVLDPNPEIGYRLEKLSNDMKIKVIVILDQSQKRWTINKDNLSIKGFGNVEIKSDVNINEWLWYFNNSNAVFTDSYHGTIFSIIFKKPFVTLINKLRGEQRFYSLLRPLKLMHRQFKTADCINNQYILFKKINYTIPHKLLLRIKNNSYNWLKNELSILN